MIHSFQGIALILGSAAIQNLKKILSCVNSSLLFIIPHMKMIIMYPSNNAIELFP